MEPDSEKLTDLVHQIIKALDDSKGFASATRLDRDQAS